MTPSVRLENNNTESLWLWEGECDLHFVLTERGMSIFFGLLSDDWILVLGIKMAMLVKEMLEFVNKFELYCTFLIKCGRQLPNYFQRVLGCVRKNGHKHFAVDRSVELFCCCKIVSSHTWLYTTQNYACMYTLHRFTHTCTQSHMHVHGVFIYSCFNPWSYRPYGLLVECAPDFTFYKLAHNACHRKAAMSHVM